MSVKNAVFIRVGCVLGIVVIALALILRWYFIADYTESKLARLNSCPKMHTLDHIDKSDNGFVVMGDSRAWEFGKWLIKDAELNISNIAVAGETSFETLCKVDASLPFEPKNKVLILSLGINDLVTASLLSAEPRQNLEREAMANLVSIATEMSTKFDRVIVFSVIPPIKPDLLRKLIWGRQIERSVKLFNHHLSEHLPSNVSILNTESIFYDDMNGRWNTSLVRDALHWNDSAFALLKEDIKTLVNY